MSSVVISGDTSGSVTLQAPAVAGSTSVLLQSGGAGLLLNTQYFTTAGTSTYTATTGTNFIIVEVVGGGAGGGTGNGTANGSGGGAGAYARKKITSSFSGTTITVGAGSAANSGTTGGTSSFGSVVTCTGGLGTTGVNTPTGTASTATGGDLNIRGGVGQKGGSSGAPGAAGGWSMIGGAAGHLQDGIYGGGGSAGLTTSQAGGSGIVIIYEYA